MEADAVEVGMGFGIEFYRSLLLPSLCEGAPLDSRSCLLSPRREEAQ